jgi:hypothetical protein
MRMDRRYRFVAAGVVAVAGLLLAACGGGGGDRGDAATATAESAAIQIEAPAERALVAVPFAVSGTANVFEAVLFVQVIDSTGVLCERRVQATSGTGTPGAWSTTLAFPPPAADREITLRAFSRGPKDGSEENLVTRTVTVSSALPPIVIEAPACGYRTVAASVLAVSGSASVFEGSLQVEVRDTTGAVVAAKTVQTAGAPERGQWTTSLDVSELQPGAYEVVAYSISPKDGSAENVFAVPFFKES